MKLFSMNLSRRLFWPPAWNGAAMNLVAPENREKYRRQVQAGFGFYLDMYLNEGGVFYFPPLEGSRLKRLYRNLSESVFKTAAVLIQSLFIRYGIQFLVYP